MTIKKSLFRNWSLIQNFFTAHLSILVRCKTKGRSRSGVRFTAHLAVERIMANYGMRWRGIFKGLSQDGGLADFSKKTSATLPLIKIY
jgi:hypothetical protein